MLSILRVWHMQTLMGLSVTPAPLEHAHGLDATELDRRHDDATFQHAPVLRTPPRIRLLPPPRVLKRI
ncbi:hypothetical protein NMY22_g8969 [Coprinellus aureogranulatus]|nr:hypothetical protein NMY22_g8969 [Coprinellus aureogranulatus]